jgi:hypothetical protein
MTDERAHTDRQGALPFRAIGIVFVALLAIGLALGLFIHRRFVQFERVVAHHVPADATFALRWDVEKVTLFEPTRAYLLPLLDLAPVAGKGTPSRRERFEAATGERLARDLREVLVVAGPTSEDWAVVAGAALRGEHAQPASFHLLGLEGWTNVSLTSEMLSPAGQSFSRAADGAWVFASSAGYADKVRRTHPVSPEIPRTGAFALFARADRGPLPPAVSRVLAGFGDVRTLRASGEWANPFPLDVHLEYAAGPPSDARARIDAVLAGLLGVELEESGPLARDVQPAGNRALRFRWLLDGPSLETLSRRCAEWVSGAPIAPLSVR